MKAVLDKLWPRRRGLFGKYVASFVGLVVFVLSINAAVEMWYSYQTTKSTLARAQSDKAETAAPRIAEFFAEPEWRVSWATRASAGTLDQHRNDYALLLKEVPAFDQLVYLDGAGREQLKVSREPVASGGNSDHGRDSIFRDAASERVSFGDAVEYRANSEPFMQIAMAHPGRNSGVTVAEINLRLLSDIVRAIPLNKGGRAYVVSAAGRLMAHSDKNATLGGDMSSLPQVAAAREPGAAPVTIGRGLDGRSVLVGSAAIPKMSWSIFVEQPLSEAFGPLYDLAERILWLLALGLLVAILAGTVQARRMLGPVRALQAGAARLGASDFSQRIEVHTGDEIEELADKFNQMAGQLSESYSRLEHKVEERTRDLAQSVRELKALEEIGRAVTSSLDLKAVLATIVARAVDLVGADAGAIFSYAEAERAFTLAEACGLDQPLVDALNAARISERGSIMTIAAAAREPVLIPDLAASDNYPYRDATLAAGFNSVLVVPLVGPEEILGALVVLRKPTGEFSPNTAGLMQTFAHQSVLAMHNAQLFHEIEDKGVQLAIANAHKSQFFANMSHELRTPLNAVLGYSELLVDGLYGDLPGRAKEVLERIQINGKHLLGLINDVLDFSKIEAGQLSLGLEEYSMKSLVESVVASTESLAQAKGLALTAVVDDGLPTGRGDDRRLRQVLLNIVGNAIKFSDAGAVEIRACAINGHFELAVRDSGPGIASEDQSRIFEEFQQVDSSSTRRKGGTGLGLAISKRLIALHGGSISVQSALGSGSTFHIVLPVRSGEQKVRA
jgi:signal transduction histidine kinase